MSTSQKTILQFRKTREVKKVTVIQYGDIELSATVAGPTHDEIVRAARIAGETVEDVTARYMISVLLEYYNCGPIIRRAVRRSKLSSV